MFVEVTERHHANNPKMNLIYNTLARAAEAERESGRAKSSTNIFTKSLTKSSTKSLTKSSTKA